MLAGSALVSLRKEILKYIIKPTIIEIGLDRPNAAALVHGTFMVESNYDHIIQIGAPKLGGFGFGQCENFTYLDHCTWIKNGFNKGLLERILKTCNLRELPKDVSALQWHLKLAVCICRVDYWRVKAQIPENAIDLSNFHKRWYNSMKGKADPVINTPMFQLALDEANEQGI